MTNFEKYNKIHDEVMKRLEDGEITTEMAKEVNDLAFEKYLLEATNNTNHKLDDSNSSTDKNDKTENKPATNISLTAKVEKIGDSDSQLKLTFFDGDKKIGKASVCDDYYGSKLSFMYNVEVNSSLRGQGYGTKIVQYMIDKYNVKYLNVAKDNKIAQNLYKKFGFKIVGNVKMDDDSIAYRMERK